MVETNREITILQSKDIKPVKKTMKMIDVDDHGCSYVWFQNHLWSFPMYKDGSVETRTEYACIVEEAPLAYKAVDEEVLRRLGVSEDTIKFTIERIGYY